jgi:hypothetical protein
MPHRRRERRECGVVEMIEPVELIERGAAGGRDAPQKQHTLDDHRQLDEQHRRNHVEHACGIAREMHQGVGRHQVRLLWESEIRNRWKAWR